MSKTHTYQLQKETQLFLKLYAFAVVVRAITYSFFSDVVYKDIFPEGHISISDKFSGIVVGVFLVAFAIMVFSASYYEGVQLRRNTLALVFIS